MKYDHPGQYIYLHLEIKNNTVKIYEATIREYVCRYSRKYHSASAAKKKKREKKEEKKKEYFTASVSV